MSKSWKSHTLIHEKAVEVPQIQDTIAIREEHKHVIKEVSNIVPKYEMQICGQACWI